MSRGRDHQWRESEGVCLDCGLSMAEMLDDLRTNGHPTCTEPLQSEPLTDESATNGSHSTSSPSPLAGGDQT